MQYLQGDDDGDNKIKARAGCADGGRSVAEMRIDIEDDPACRRQGDLRVGVKERRQKEKRKEKEKAAVVGVGEKSHEPLI